MIVLSKNSYEKMVKEHQAAIRGLFLNLTLGDEMLSDDLAQETFIKAYTSWSSFKMLSSAKTWLFRIAYNVFYDYRRSLKITTSIDQAPSSHTTPDSLKMDIYQAMKMLTETERICVTMGIIEGYTMKEIAKITSMNENTVKSHIFRGKDKLETYLKQNGYG